MEEMARMEKGTHAGWVILFYQFCDAMERERHNDN